MNSSLYQCTVRHQRLAPKQHNFEHDIFMCYIDLDELGQLSKKLWLFSHNRKNVYSFRDADHFLNDTINLKEKVTAYLAQHQIELGPQGRIQLLTLPRVLGYIFNPVSFYFCFKADGAPACVIAEVGNTFREMKLFLLDSREFNPEKQQFQKVCVKNFYVSPFSSLDLSFEFKLNVPDEKLEIRIDDRGEAGKVLLSQLLGERREFNNRNLFWFTLKYPFMTLKVIFFIHWHALRLYLKRVPFFRKSAHPELQQAVLNPHSTLVNKSSQVSP